MFKCCVKIIDLHRDETCLIMVHDFFNVSLVSVSKNFVENFASMYTRDIGLMNFHFLDESSPGFSIRIIVAL
jgi:hypothetical protein